MGITVIPYTMIPNELKAVDNASLPKLTDTHVSLLKHRADNQAINILEGFVLWKLRH